MAQRKTDEERLQELQKKMEQLKNQEKALKEKANKKARAERTRRLIEKGALAEKYLKCENTSPAEFEKLLIKLVEIEQVKKLTKSELEKSYNDTKKGTAILVEHDLIEDNE